MAETWHALGRPARILIADRNPHVRELLRRELTAEGYQVRVARDGQELLNLINGADPPDLLVLDLEVPYLNELAVMARLRERLPSLPVIIHSLSPAYAEQPPPEAAAFLEKEEDIDHLKAVIAEVLARHYRS
jgi:CheY-like chemotaxis protein